jgi:hypothetical protein
MSSSSKTDIHFDCKGGTEQIDDILVIGIRL